MALTKAMLSSVSMEWETPRYFVDALEDHLDLKFTLDAAASKENAKAPAFWTEEDDALDQDWSGVVFCNPPYGRALPKFVKKGYDESRAQGSTVVMLIPARTDTRWFHDYAAKGHIVFLRGRIKFLLDGEETGSPAFPSMAVVFGPDVVPGVSYWDWKQDIKDQ